MSHLQIKKREFLGGRCVARITRVLLRVMVEGVPGRSVSQAIVGLGSEVIGVVELLRSNGCLRSFRFAGCHPRSATAFKFEETFSYNSWKIELIRGTTSVRDRVSVSKWSYFHSMNSAFFYTTQFWIFHSTPKHLWPAKEQWHMAPRSILATRDGDHWYN